MIIFDKIKANLTALIALVSVFIGYRLSDNKRKVENLKEALDDKEQIIESIKESAEVERIVDDLSVDDMHERLRKYYRD